MQTLWIAILIFVGLNAVAVGSVLFSQWKRWRVDLTEYRHYTMVIFNVCGIVYALYLGFVIWDVWEDFDHVKRTVYTEATTLTDLYRDSAVFAEEGQMRDAIRAYLHHVVDTEWNQLARRHTFESGEGHVADLWNAYYNYTPRNDKELAWYAQAIDKLNVFNEARMDRLFNARVGIGAVRWLLLLLGGVVLVSIPCFFRIELLAFKLILTLFLANIVAFMLFLTYSLDHPFSGYGRINIYPFEYALEFLK